jgi:magnesium transporter
MREIMCAGVRWIDLQKPTREEVMSLSDTFPFHHLNLEDCLSKIQLTKVERHKDHLFIVLRFPFLCEGIKCSASQVSFFIGRDYLITIQDGSVGALKDVFSECEKSKKPIKPGLGGVGSLFYKILNAIIDSLFPIMEILMDNLENLEDLVYNPKKEALYETTKLRRSISDLRRLISPLRRVLGEIEIGVRDLTGDDLGIYFADLKDHLEKIWELSDTCMELVEIYKDTDYIVYQHRMNRALVILTVIFTATIPATTLGTFYGMNINLPGGITTGAWGFLGSYSTFWIILLVSLVPAFLMLLYFKRLGWL